METFFAVLHDNSLAGDSSFYAENFLRYEESDTKESLVRKLARETVGVIGDQEDDDYVKNEFNEIMKEAKGAWIIDDKTRQVIDAMYKDNQPTNDTAVYIMNRAAKNICEEMAIRNLRFD